MPELLTCAEYLTEFLPGYFSIMIDPEKEMSEYTRQADRISALFQLPYQGRHPTPLWDVIFGD